MTREMRRVLGQPARRIETPFMTKYKHTVVPDKGGTFYRVVSGLSGQVYRVTPTGGQHATCDCQGFEHTQLPCSHVAAVIEYSSVILQEQTRRRL